MAIFEFVVLRVNVDRDVSVEIHDLRGRRVRRLQENRAEATGAYQIEWDGRDQNGKLVPPGLYVAKVGVNTDASGTEAVAVVVGVAY
jgi:flagellar hook assembly protein FlgD